MKINQHNYETFFLLYADNELTAEERKEVEAFVELHEEFRNEFLQIQDTVLPLETITFDSKKDLYKAQVIESALQERLLEHVDGELDGEALNEMNQLIATNPALRTEWEGLLKAKLDPADIIVFPDKRSLNRTSTRVIVMRFTRIAVAAAFIGLGIFTGIRLVNRSGISDNPGTTTPIAGKSTPVIQQPTINTGNVQPKIEEQLATVTKEEPQEKPITLPLKKGEAPVRNDVIAKQDEKELPLIASQDVIVERAVTEPNTATLQTNNSRPAEMIIDKDITPVENTMAITASLDNTEENTDRILYMKEETFSRSKAASFLRKVKRVVERNTKIKTGENLRIGGFEIAIK